MTLIAVVDFETAGDDPPTPLELGVVWVHLLRGGATRLLPQRASALLRYRGGPAPSARGVHHIAPGPLRRARHPSTVLRRHWLPAALVAAYHHAQYDGPVLGVALRSAGLPAPPLQVCTLRCAKHLWPTAPDYKLGTLRYWLGLRAVPPAWAVPHRALYDAVVCAALLRRMLATTSLSELVRLSDPALPVLLPAVPFGVHRGKQWAEVPADYLGWMMRAVRGDPEAFDVDARYTAREEILLRRRRHDANSPRAVQGPAVQGAPQPAIQAAAGGVDAGPGGAAAPHVAGPVELHHGGHSGAVRGELGGGAGQGQPPALGGPPSQERAGAADGAQADQGSDTKAAPRGDA